MSLDSILAEQRRCLAEMEHYAHEPDAVEAGRRSNRQMAQMGIDDWTMEEVLTMDYEVWH